MSALTMVALSGGVDSATTAWLLQRQGESIAAMFMKNWEGDDHNDGCSAEVDAADAQSVAEQLGIKFYARNFATEYWENVFEAFLAELRAGRTPNPDILCNREIKFKAFLDHAMELGAECIATGHYARRRVLDDGSVALLKGVDHNKDQSYFLYGLDQAQLQKARFPLGELTKDEVRQLAHEAHLPVASKKDSTGICFIGERRFDDFIDDYLTGQPGPIVCVDEGSEVGTHTGLMHYTLGQRKGLAIGGLRHHPEAPWFVVDKDIKTNTLYAAQDSHHPMLMSTRIQAHQAHWIAGAPPSLGVALTAKIRYRQADQPCQITAIDGECITVVFDNPQRAATPGQSLVLYDGERCLGGAVISATNAPKPEPTLDTLMMA